MSTGTDLAIAREDLPSSVWSRVLPVMLVALTYLVVIGGLRLGRRRAYRQVIFISVIVLLGVGLAMFQPFPWWVRAVNVAKALVVLALLFLASRPQVRSWFRRHQPTRRG
ncbi:hypothetical protein GA0070607_4787 [Micromonospora coriariae]|uniref:Uncharacterized protein n=1 Tax=Micromonospora coriariae TaxID=285665 RepID=A0A1C4X7G3_9ACTN|nr:hypothetical protein GA0070607_4787 [Micromonospora coriariae]